MTYMVFASLFVRLPGTRVNRFSGIGLHPLHGRMFACFVIPRARMDEDRLRWKRHVEGDFGQESLTREKLDCLDIGICVLME